MTPHMPGVWCHACCCTRPGPLQLNATATPTSDVAKVEQVLDKFRAKYGAGDVEAYYPKQEVAVEVPLA
jgi:hypothetical protein